MNAYDWQQTLLLFAALLLFVKPFGTYMAKVYQGENTVAAADRKSVV